MDICKQTLLVVKEIAYCLNVIKSSMKKEEQNRTVKVSVWTFVDELKSEACHVLTSKSVTAGGVVNI